MVGLLGQLTQPIIDAADEAIEARQRTLFQCRFSCHGPSLAIYRAPANVLAKNHILPIDVIDTCIGQLDGFLNGVA